MLHLFETRLNHVVNHDKLVKGLMAKTNGDNQVHNAEINVEGVVPERQRAAGEEIRWYLQLLSTVTRELRAEVCVKRVVVAKDFNATVSELSSLYKAYGIAYKAQRRAVRAVGIILDHIENERISFSLVFDGEVFGSWEEQGKAFRFEKFLHELLHTVLDSVRFERVGAENFYPNEKTAEGVCLSLALVSWKEYEVDRIVDKLCTVTLFDDDHKPVQLAKLQSAEGVDFRATLSELIDKMPGFVTQNVRDFKLWHMTMDTLWPRMCGFVDELLTVFAHYAAAHDRQEGWLQALADISQAPAYRLFLSGHLEAIHSEWQRWFDEPDSDEARSLEAIGNEIRGIFRRCGLTLANVSSGIYVQVNFT